MKAAIKPRINRENRTKLETVIPLSTPMVLFVDPSSACNFKCKFCPNGDVKLIRSTGRWQGKMNMDVYKKIIDGLKDFDEPLKVLRLYKEGEPFLNKNFAEMILYAKKAGITRSIDTTTNGYFLELEKIKPVLDAGIDRINISVDGLSDEQFFDFTGVKVDFENYVNNIRKLYEIKNTCEICIKIAGDFLSEEDKKKFYRIFGNYADRIFIENVAPCWPEFDVQDRLGVKMDKGIYDQPLSEVNICPYIFYSMSVNSDGTVSLCFLDWARKSIIGDVRKDSLKNIWTGNDLFEHQRQHLLGKRTQNPICAACGQLSHCLPDNIDLFAEKLLKKLMDSQGKTHD